jgi:hypothetical protein
MHDLTKIKEHARTNIVYDDQHPAGGRGFICVLDGQTIVCSHSVQSDSYTWFVQGQPVRESDVRRLLSA